MSCSDIAGEYLAKLADFPFDSIWCFFTDGYGIAFTMAFWAFIAIPLGIYTRSAKLMAVLTIFIGGLFIPQLPGIGAKVTILIFVLTVTTVFYLLIRRTDDTAL